MKKIILLLGGLFVAASSWAGMGQDSTVSVISWFSTRDTMIYNTYVNEWKIKETDTVKTSGVSQKVMLTVTDSTRNGYAMEYRFLGFGFDSTVVSPLGQYEEKLIQTLGDKIAGTRILFRTDEYGRIIGYDNLKSIKKQAKSLYKESCKELMKQPFMDTLKTAGFRISNLLKLVDVDELVQGYVEELELLLLCHGKQYAIGESLEHEEETEDRYASDTYLRVGQDDESGEYAIVCEVNTYLPPEDTRSLVNNVVGYISDDNEFKAQASDEIEKQITETMVVNTYLAMNYFYDGWPSEVVSQSRTTLQGQEKVEQTYIVWDYRSVCNY